MRLSAFGTVKLSCWKQFLCPLFFNSAVVRKWEEWEDGWASHLQIEKLDNNIYLHQHEYSKGRQGSRHVSDVWLNKNDRWTGELEVSAVEAVRAADPVLVLAATSGTLHPLTLPGLHTLHNLHNLLRRHVSNVWHWQCVGNGAEKASTIAFS